MLNVSTSTAARWAKIYVRQGKLERVSNYPATYQKKGKIFDQLDLVGDFRPVRTPTPTDIPCKFGASFAQVGKPPLQYASDGKAHDEQGTHHAIFGRYKTVIWLKAGFKGETPDEIIKNGNLTLQSLAEGYAQKYGISLAYLRTFLDIEWVMVDMAHGKALSKREGIKNGERKEIAGVWHKQGDSSHPKHRQYQAMADGDQEGPTEHARVDHFVYSGELAKTLNALGENQKKNSEVLDKLVEVQVQIRQRLDVQMKD